MLIFQSITPFVEIVIITVMINYILSIFWNTRSMDLMLGLLAFLLIFAASETFHLPILHKLMLLVGNVAVLAIIVIFQSELRLALSKLSLKGKRYFFPTLQIRNGMIGIGRCQIELKRLKSLGSILK